MYRVAKIWFPYCTCLQLTQNKAKFCLLVLALTLSMSLCVCVFSVTFFLFLMILYLMISTKMTCMLLVFLRNFSYPKVTFSSLYSREFYRLRFYISVYALFRNNFHILQGIYQSSLHTLAEVPLTEKRTIFSPENCLCNFVKYSF